MQSLPGKLESFTSEKRFLSAVESLQEGIRLVHRPEMDGIGGLNELRNYFSNQEQVRSAEDVCRANACSI